MLAPETTSAEAFWRYAGGQCLFESRGEAWRDIKAWITAMPLAVDVLHIPAVSEPFITWITSGELDFQEREEGQPWIASRIQKGSFFLTTGGNPYQIRWRAVSIEPFESMLVFLELPVLQRALEEVFGGNAESARLRDASAFADEGLNALLGLLREELMPQVDKAYRVAKGREARAIAGLSMGGTQSLYTGLNYPDQFGWVGSFSGAINWYGDNFAGYFPTLDAKTVAKFRLLWIACGTEDGLIRQNRNFESWLKDKGAKFSYKETPGGHTWMVWKRNLAELAPLLFTNAKP